MKVIKIIGVAHGIDTEHDDRYLVEFDFNKNTLQGLTTTPDIEGAKKFDTFKDALIYWNTVSPIEPVRFTDGKPNKPLTGWHSAFEEWNG